MLVARACARPLVAISGVDGRRFDGQLDRAGPGRAVETELAAGLVESTVNGRDAKVIDGEIGEGVEGVQRIGVRCSDRGNRKRGKRQQKKWS